MTGKVLKSMSNALVLLSFVLSAVGMSAGCRRSPPPAPAAGEKVAKIVFVTKKNACKCTRERAEVSWESLQVAMGKKSRIPVERIHIDTEDDKVKPFQKMRAIMVIPAVYFLDKKGRLVGALQGELKAEQIAKILDNK